MLLNIELMNVFIMVGKIMEFGSFVNNANTYHLINVLDEMQAVERYSSIHDSITCDITSIVYEIR